MSKKSILITILFSLSSFLAVVTISHEQAFAADIGFQLSPMNQKISLNPGERYYGTFKVTNPSTSEGKFRYKTDISPFTVDDNYEIRYENNGDYNQIVNWIVIENGDGVIEQNDTEIIKFYVDVPEDAPAGGQYAAIVVSSAGETEKLEGVNIVSKYSIAHVLYAEVAGETVRGGEINSVNVPSFLFSGKISGTASIKNTGNVHSDAAYTLQVFPLFSKEEIYTNEENPTTNTIIPDATRTTVIYWDETPSIGIFHVIYKASFEGVDNTVDKVVIVCPLWLLLLIIFVIILIAFRIIWGGKKEKKHR